jgi:hypothetical protein
MRFLLIFIIICCIILTGCSNNNLTKKYIEENCNLKCDVMSDKTEFKAGEYLEMECYYIDNQTGLPCF